MNFARPGACACAALLWLAACTPAPMPAPASGQAPPQDAKAPADVSQAQRENPVLPPPGMASPEPVSSDLSTAIADHWLGTWRGPEGTSLLVERQEVGYRLVVTNLDGPREFHGIAADDVIEFERDGKKETLRAGDGVDTGMKWLVGKRDCLVVHKGEGYCRD